MAAGLPAAAPIAHANLPAGFVRVHTYLSFHTERSGCVVCDITVYCRVYKKANRQSLVLYIFLFDYTG